MAKHQASNIEVAYAVEQLTDWFDNHQTVRRLFITCESKRGATRRYLRVYSLNLENANLREITAMVATACKYSLINRGEGWQLVVGGSGFSARADVVNRLGQAIPGGQFQYQAI